MQTNCKKDYQNIFQALINYILNLIYKEKKEGMNLIEIKISPNQLLYSVEEKRTKELIGRK